MNPLTPETYCLFRWTGNPPVNKQIHDIILHMKLKQEEERVTGMLAWREWPGKLS